MRVIVRLIALLMVLPSALIAQSTAKQPSRAELDAEIARLRAALAECRSSKNASRREDAIASVRAVQSALGTGANLEEFKRYQIESRIKVDALPSIPENAPIKEISDLFADAVRFRIVQATGGRIEAREIAAAKTRYADDTDVSKALTEMQSEDVVQTLTADPEPMPNIDMPRTEKGKELAAQLAQTLRETEQRKTEVLRETARRRNAETARHISVLLILAAEKKLLTLK
jgi:hypothetical protein